MTDAEPTWLVPIYPDNAVPVYSGNVPDKLILINKETLEIEGLYKQITDEEFNNDEA